MWLSTLFLSSSNLLFGFLLVIGPLVSISSSSWVFCWAGMEVGFFGLVPLLLLGNSSIAKESALKYFCIQALASAFLFLSGLAIFDLHFLSLLGLLGFLGALCLKLGVFPGHFWVPTIVFGLEWVPCCLILGPLKVAPLAFLSSLSACVQNGQSILLLIGGVSAITGAVMGNNQTSVRGMIGASSISHGGWMVLGSVFGALWSYVLIYFLVLFFALLFLWKDDALSSCLALLSMSGLPPFVMFLAKFGIVSAVLTQSGSFTFLILPLVGALLSLIFYLKFSYSFYLTGWKMPSTTPFILSLVINLLGVGWLVCVMFFDGRDSQ